MQLFNVRSPNHRFLPKTSVANTPQIIILGLTAMAATVSALPNPVPVPSMRSLPRAPLTPPSTSQSTSTSPPPSLPLHQPPPLTPPRLETRTLHARTDLSCYTSSNPSWGWAGGVDSAIVGLCTNIVGNGRQVAAREKVTGANDYGEGNKLRGNIYGRSQSVWVSHRNCVDIMNYIQLRCIRTDGSAGRPWLYGGEATEANIWAELWFAK